MLRPSCSHLGDPPQKGKHCPRQLSKCWGPSKNTIPWIRLWPQPKFLFVLETKLLCQQIKSVSWQVKKDGVFSHINTKWLRKDNVHSCLQQLYELNLGSHDINGECQAACSGPGGWGNGVSWQHKGRAIWGKWGKDYDRIDTGRNPGPRLRFLL